jgi:hypothetical protein
VGTKRPSRTSRVLADDLARRDLAMTPAGRLDLALELSDLCDSLAKAGARAARKR